MIMRMLYRIRNALSAFMYGRYGLDNLGNFLTLMFFILWLLGIFTGSLIVAALELLVLFWLWFRMLSRNIEKRRKENQRYLSIKAGLKRFFTFGKGGNGSKSGSGKKSGKDSPSLREEKKKFKKTHVFIKCPGCKNNLRLPKVKGRHTVRCPVCSKSFDVKI